MKALKSISRFVRKWWWAIAGAAVGLFAVMWRALAAAARPPREDDLPDEKPTFAERAEERVERIELEAEVERARVRAASEAQHAEIATIEEKAKTDPAAARADIADFLRRNL